jgi:hypothetical protein
MPVVSGVDALLRDLAGRNPNERVRRAVAVAAGLDGVERRRSLVDLGGREAYWRHLAVTMAATTGELAHVVAALRDVYPAVRRHALGVPGLPADVLAGLVEDGSWTERLSLYASLRSGRRSELADRLVPAVARRWGDAEAARLLPACSDPVVAEWLPILGYAVVGWRSLTARCPDTVVGYADSQLAGLGTEARTLWWGRTGRCVG